MNEHVAEHAGKTQEEPEQAFANSMMGQAQIEDQHAAFLRQAQEYISIVAIVHTWHAELFSILLSILSTGDRQPDPMYARKGYSMPHVGVNAPERRKNRCTRSDSVPHVGTTSSSQDLPSCFSVYSFPSPFQARLLLPPFPAVLPNRGNLSRLPV